jgi:hypothetical protein
MEFARAQLPMERARPAGDGQVAADDSPELAVVEAKGALQDFERLGRRYADAAGALLRSLSAPVRTGSKGGVGALTKRETEVLALPVPGSNPESRTGSTSPGRRWRPMWGTCCRSSACATAPRRRVRGTGGHPV